MDLQRRYYPESAIGGFTNVDGTVNFYSRVNSLLHPASRVADIGCGVGVYAADPIGFRRELRILKGKVREVVGLDVDPEASRNPFIDNFCLIRGGRWPVDDNSFDLCLADNVLEHLEEPGAFFAECRRILKPGGFVCIRTPNLLSYFGLFSELVPNVLHLQVLKRVKGNIQHENVFPTLYRCNTLRRVRKMLSSNGFEACVYGYDSEPTYLSFSRVFYALGVLHQRFAPNFIKVGIHAFGRRLP